MAEELNFQFHDRELAEADRSPWLSGDALSKLTSRTRLPFGVIRHSDSVFDLRFGGQALHGVDYRALEIEDKANYLHTVSHGESRYIWRTLREWRKANFKSSLKDPLPSGVDIEYTEGGQLYYVNHNTNENSWELPVVDIQSDAVA